MISTLDPRSTREQIMDWKVDQISWRWDLKRADGVGYLRCGPKEVCAPARSYPTAKGIKKKLNNCGAEELA